MPARPPLARTAWAAAALVAPLLVVPASAGAATAPVPTAPAPAAPAPAAPAPTAPAPAAPAPAAPAPAPSAPVVADGLTQPVFDYEGAVRESVRVEAPDADGDGQPDLVVADIIRPAELDADVPVIMDASPYHLCCGRGLESQRKTYDADGQPVDFPLFYDNYFVPRGYAYVAVDMAGTGRSTGCTDVGGRSDVDSVAAVVEWLAGEGTAYDADGEVVEASWSAGRTGMIGKSYDGTLATGVAAAGTTGLETIVPIAAISSWYDYTRAGDLPFSTGYLPYLGRYVSQQRTEPVDCAASLTQLGVEADDASGTYNDVWAERDYREGGERADGPYDASKIEASVFVVHGLQDDNVKMRHFSELWDELVEHDVERRLWLIRSGHTDPFDSDRQEWVRELHRWFDAELMDVDNGIGDEPSVRVETRPGEIRRSDSWPVPTRTVRLQPQGDGTLAPARRTQGDVVVTSDPRQREAAAVTLPVDGAANPHRLLWTSGELREDVRISGTPRVDLEVAHGAATGQVGVMLVDYGAADRVLTTGGGVRALETRSCWGEGVPADTGCFLDAEVLVGETPLQVLARGALRLPGAGTHEVSVEMQSQDVVVPAGHRIGLVVVGAYPGWVTTVDGGSTSYSVDLARTALHLPVQGRAAFLGGARAAVPAADELVAGTLPRLGERQVPQ
ncbi:CocE/NonD family hydrolase [uncultured Pseudokineococcus sp.]|uniref:CocE/NonD family hydrolase n=1 Tax=uncultured Pseudokineococcus sp. TaxID=1642928 RepID=UPI0026040755|nr:CocE/NonD family hydrolase [uncultured Pseudokineococcus sp.]